MTRRFEIEETGDRAALATPGRPHLLEEELAQRWRLSTRTLQRWRCDGAGPPYLRLGRRIAYRLSDVEHFETTHLRVGQPS